MHSSIRMGIRKDAWFTHTVVFLVAFLMLASVGLFGAPRRAIASDGHAGGSDIAQAEGIVAQEDGMDSDPTGAQGVVPVGSEMHGAGDATSIDVGEGAGTEAGDADATAAAAPTSLESGGAEIPDMAGARDDVSSGAVATDEGEGVDASGEGGKDATGDGEDAGSTDGSVDESDGQDFAEGCAQVIELGADGYFETEAGKGNAIQRAINAALAHVSDVEGAKPDKVTIVVYKGSYDGNLNATLARSITRDGSTEQTHYELPVGFTLVLVADEVRDATMAEDWVASSGASVINGSLNVEDMSLEVRGLWFKGHSISVKKGSVDGKSATVDRVAFYGTNQDDGMSLTLKEVKTYYVNSGDGDDVISVNLSRGDLESFTGMGGTVTTGPGNDTISLAGSDADGGYVINVNTGDGDDVITVNATLRGAANTLKGGSVSIDAGEGMDRVHFTGSLTEIKNDDNNLCLVNINGSREAITMYGGSTKDTSKNVWVDGGDLSLTFANLEAYTDELGNKPQTKLTVGSDNTLVYAETIQSFMDYVLQHADKSAVGTIVSVIFTDTSPNVLLASLKIAATLISQLIAPNLNVVNVTSSAEAGVSTHEGQRIGLPENVSVEAFAAAHPAGDGFVGIRARNIILRDSDSDNYKSGATLEIPGAISWALDGKSAIDLATWNFSVNSAVTIDADATLDASEFVIVEASCSQEKGFLPTTIPYVKINAVTMKWGTATITVKGTIKASGSVSIAASGKVKIDATVEKVPIPIAIAFAALDVGTYLDGATITAGGSVSVSSTASADLTAQTKQDTSPIMAAVNIGLVYGETSAKGASITAVGDVRLNGTSSLKQSATAKYDGTSKTSGGFFTVNVSDQDATAVVDAGTIVDAGGIVVVAAKANQSSTALASSGNSVSGYAGEKTTNTDNYSSSAKDKDGVDTSSRESKWADLDFGSLFDLVKQIFGKVGENGSTNNQITGKIGTGLERLSEQTDSGNENPSDDELVDVDDAPAAGAGDGGLTAAAAGDAAEGGSGGTPSGDAGSDSGASDAAPNVTEVFNTALSSTSGKVSDAKTSKTHVAGAIAVSVVNNSADAHVAKGATVKSGGRLAVRATASTSASTTADASMAVSDVGSASNPTTSDGTVTTSAQQKKMGTESHNKEINIVTGTYGDKDDAATTIWVSTNGGSYSATGSTIEVTGGQEIKNEGGTVQIKERSSLLEKNQIQIAGGTTTIEHVNVTIDAGKDGTLTWTAGEDVNGNTYVDIFNKNTTTTTDGAASTTNTGGTVRIYGGTLTIQNGVKVTLTDVTMVIKNGMLYIEYGGSDPDVHITQDPSAKTATITGNFTFKSTAGGEVSFAVSGPVDIEKATAKLTKIYVHSIKVTSSRTVNIDYFGGETKSNKDDNIIPAGTTPTVKNMKDDSVGTSVNVSVDLTDGKSDKITFEGTAKNADQKDAEGTLKLGEVKTTGEGDEKTTDVLMWLEGGGSMKLADGATLTLPGDALYRVINGEHGSMTHDDGTFDEYWSATGGRTMTIYVDFTQDFELAVDGSYSGRILFSQLFFTPKKVDIDDEPESLKGRYHLSDATVTLTGAKILLKKGRLTITLTGTDAKLEKNSDGTFTITGGKLALTMGAATLDVSGGSMTIKDGKITLQASKENTEQTALGAGVAVNVHTNKTTAYVDEGAVVSSSGLEVVANTTNAYDSVSAHAGFSNAETAVGGAIAIQVTNFETVAEVREGADVTLAGGPLTVRAGAVTTLKTVADAPVSAKGSGTGVGAGIAVEVAGIETRATVADGTVKRAKAATMLDSVTIEATQKMPRFAEYPNQVRASAGASGGTAVTPALALIVGGSQALAYLGTGDVIDATGDVSVTAYNEVERSQTGNAAASGSSVGVGGAFAIAVLNDSTTAQVRRTVGGRKVSVRATGIQRTKTETKSGVKGTPAKTSTGSDSTSGGGEAGSSGSSGGNDAEGDQPSSGSSEGDSEGGSSASEDAAPTADETADSLIASGARLGQLSHSNCLTSAQIEALTSERQKAETSEGSVSVAAAFSLTIAKNVVLAEIADGCDVTAAGDLTVEAIRDTDSKVVANGATTTAKTGVGVGVAINVVTTEGTARIGTRLVRINDPRWPDRDTGRMGTGLVSATGNVTVAARQLDDSKDDEDDADTLDLFVEYMKKMADDLLASTTQETGLQGIAALIHGTLTDKLNARMANIEKTIENHKNEIFKMVTKNLMNMVFSRFASNVQWDWKSGVADVDAVVESIAKDVFQDLFDTGKLKSYLTGNVGEIVKIANKTLNRSLNDIRRAVFGFLAKAFGEGEAAPASSYTTYAIAGAGASDIGVAGSVAIAVVNAKNAATIAGSDVIAVLADVTSGGTLAIVAETSETFDTVATAAVTDAELPEKNKNAAEKADSNTTTIVDNSGKTANSGTATSEADPAGSGSEGSTPDDSDSGKGVGVGAGFAFVYADLDCEAMLGENRRVIANAIDIHASAANKAETFAVAGTDPLEDTSSSQKETAIDAAVALNILDVETTAAVGAGSVVTARGAAKANAVSYGDESYSLIVAAKTDGDTLAKASGFACGDRTAVGAAVTVNIVTGKTEATFAGTGTVVGSALVDVTETSGDDAVATATAMGADLQRYFTKFANGMETINEWADKIASGKVELKAPKAKENKTAKKIVTVLNAVSNTNDTEGGAAPTAADEGASLSTNVLATQDVSTVTTPPTAEGTDAVTSATNQTAAPTADADADNGNKKVLVAAAVAVNVVAHKAHAILKGTLTSTGAASYVTVDATNRANYRAYATGAAMTASKALAAVGAAVAVGVNANEAIARIEGSANSASDVDVTATLTQNMDGTYAGLLAAQTIAGAASGSGSTATVAGAVSVLVAKGTVEAAVADGATVTATGDATVTAYNKSKYALRAGALSASGGSKVGVGASFALIYARDEVSAIVGKAANVTARDLTVSAERAMVTFSDYALGKDWSALYEIKPGQRKQDVPDSTVTEAKNQAIITITEKVEGQGDNQKVSYDVDINIDTDTLLDAIDLLNFLSSTNYYAEAISGAASASGTASVAGAFAFVFGGTTIEAIIDEAARVTLTGDLTVLAVSGTNTRIIAGSLSASGAKVGVGATIAVYVDTRTTTARIGKNATVTAAGKVTVSARGSEVGYGDEDGDGTPDGETSYRSADVLVIAVAPAVTSGKLAVGATVPVIVTEDVYAAEVADGATLTAGGDVLVVAQTSSKLLPIALAVAVSGQVAVGGNVLVLVQKTETHARIGAGATVTSSAGGVRVAATGDEFLVMVLPSVGAAKTVGVAATIAAIVSRSDTAATVGEAASIRAKGDVAVEAASESFMVAVSVGAGAGSTAGVGAVVNVFVFDRDVLAEVARHASLISDEGDVIVKATALDYAVIVAVGAAGASTAAVSGTIPVLVSTNRVRALVGSYDEDPDEHDDARLEAGAATGKAATTLRAMRGSIGVVADYAGKTYLAAGGFAGAGTAAVGATVLTAVMQNHVQGLVGYGAQLFAGGSGAGVVLPSEASSNKRRRGIVVDANLAAETLLVGIAGGGAGTVAVNGTVITGVFEDVVHAIIYGGGSTNARYGDDDAEGDLATSSSAEGGDLAVISNATSDLKLIGGSLSGAGTVGVGATVVTLVYDRDLEASLNAHATGTVHARGVEVRAGSESADATADTVWVFAVSISGAGTVAVSAGVSVIYHDSHTVAALGGTVDAMGDVSVIARSGMELINASAGVAGSGTASVSGIVMVTYFRSVTTADILAGSTLTAGGDVRVEATSAESTNIDALGITGSGTAAVSGTVSTVFTYVTTTATVGKGARVTARNLAVTATDDFYLLGIVGTVAGAGVAGVGVTALIGTSHNTVEATIAENAVVTCTGDVSVIATGERDVQIYLATVAAGGVAGVGVNVLVFVAGGNITQDSADAVRGDGTNKTFDGDQLQDDLGTTLFGGGDSKGVLGADTAAGKSVKAKLNSSRLSDELAGDGTRMSDTSIAADGDFDVTGDFGMADDPDYREDGKSTIPSKDGYSTSDLHEVTNIVTAGERNLGTGTVPVITGTDAVRATIAAGASVFAHDVTVSATDTLTIDLMAFTVAGAGIAGVAPSVVVGATYANAIAAVESGATIAATGTVSVAAKTGSKVIVEGDDANEKARNKSVKDNVGESSDETAKQITFNGEQYTIFTARGVRAISAAGGGALVGVGIAISYLGLDSNAYAYVAGSITKAADVSVTATTCFPLVASATFGVGAGLVGVTFSGSFAFARGMAYAGIVGVAQVTGVTGDVSVTSDTTFNAASFAAALAGGGVAVNGAVAVTDDLMDVYTFVGRAVALDVAGTLNVRATGLVAGNASVLGASVGAIAAGVNVGVVNVRPTILTFVGASPLAGKPVVGADGSNNAAKLGDLTVANDFATSAKASLFGIAAGAISAAGNVLVVTNSTVARAGIFGKDVTVSGAARISSALADEAVAGLVSGASGLATVGANTFVARLSSDNRAVVDSTDATMNFGSLSVAVGSEDAPNVTSAVAKGLGANSGAISVSVNVGVASNETTNNAELTGTGTIAVGGAVSVTADGRATATASIDPGIASVSGASVAANVALASVTATQVARIASGATLTTDGGAIAVASRLNLPSGATTYGTDAKVGSNGGVSVSIVGIGVSVAKAKMDATVRAVVEDATVDTRKADGSDAGAVNVAVGARSNASTDVISPTVSISGARVGVIVTRADAAGTFETRFSGKGSIGSTSVTTDYGSSSSAAVGPTGGVAVGLVAIDVNVATSKVTTTTTAIFEGTDDIRVMGDLTVAAIGTGVTSKAEGKTYLVEVSGLTVAVNDVTATLDATQEAELVVTGTFTATGGVSVTSTLGSATTSTVGSSAGSTGVSVSLASVKANTTHADSSSTNTATVRGTNAVTSRLVAASLSVSATTDSTTSSTARTSFTIGLLTIGSLAAHAKGSDAASASLDGLAVVTTGAVAVLASTKGNVTSLSQAPGSLNAIGSANTRSETDLGSASDPTSASVRIGDGVTIDAGGNVTVLADAFGRTEASVKADKNYSIIGGTVDATLKTRSNMASEATVGDGAIIRSGKDVSVDATLTTESTSDATASVLGLVVSTARTYADVDDTQKVVTQVGKASVIEAAGNVRVGSGATMRQTSTTKADAAGGFVGEGDLYSESNLTRTVATSVAEGARIVSRGGNVSVIAEAGGSDSMRGKAIVDADGGVSYAHTNLSASINSAVSLTLAAGVIAEAAQGTIDIHSDASLRSYEGNSEVKGYGGLGSEPYARMITNLTNAATTTVGEEGKDKVSISGLRVIVDARVSTLRLNDYSTSRGTGAGANIDAHAFVNLTMPVVTTVKNAIITSVESTRVTATVDPSSVDGTNKNLYVHSYVSTSALFSVAGAKARIDTNRTSTTVDVAGTTITGNTVTLAAENRLRYETVADEDGDTTTFNPETNNSSGQLSSTLTIADDCEFYVGATASGILVEINEGENGVPTVNAVGGGQVYVDGTVVHVSTPTGGAGGTLDSYAYNTGTGRTTNVIVPSARIFAVDTVSLVRVANNTDCDVWIDDLSTDGLTGGSVTHNGSPVSATVQAATEAPLIDIMSKGSGSVVVAGLIYNPRGAVSIRWVDGAAGALFALREWLSVSTMNGHAAPIWAHTLTIEGARSVGTSTRLEAYLCWLDDERPSLAVDAEGDVVLGVTDLKIASGTAGTPQPREALAAENVRAGGKLDVLVHTAATLYRSAGDQVPKILTAPDTISYDDGATTTLTEDVTLAADELERYLAFVDADGVRTYSLPNGAVITADADGKILTIFDGETLVDVEHLVYRNDAGHLEVAVAEGITLDLTDKTLSIAEGLTLSLSRNNVDADAVRDAIRAGNADFTINGVPYEAVHLTEGDGTHFTYYLAPSGLDFESFQDLYNHLTEQGQADRLYAIYASRDNRIGVYGLSICHVKSLTRGQLIDYDLHMTVGSSLGDDGQVIWHFSASGGSDDSITITGGPGRLAIYPNKYPGSRVLTDIYPTGWDGLSLHTDGRIIWSDEVRVLFPERFFTSGRVVVGNMAAAGEIDELNIAHGVTLKAGQQAKLERLTDDVARDVYGGYHVLVDGKWAVADVNVTTGTDEQGRELATTTVTRNGTTYLVIRRHTNASATYYTEYHLPSGTVVDSEGTAMHAAAVPDVLVEDSGSGYRMDALEAASVSVRVEDVAEGVRLVGGTHTSVTADSIRLVVAGAASAVDDSVSFAARTAEATVTPVIDDCNDPLEQGVIVEDLTRSVNGDAVLPYDLVIRAGATLRFEATGTVTFGTIIVEAGATLELVGTAGITGTRIVAKTGATVRLSSDGSVSIAEFDVTGTTLTLVTGSATLAIDMLTADADTTATLSSGGAVDLGTITAKNRSIVTVTAVEHLVFMGLAASDASTIEVHAPWGITGGTVSSSTGSAVTLVTNQAVELGAVTTFNQTGGATTSVTIMAGANVSYATIDTTRDASITITAGATDVDNVSAQALAGTVVGGAITMGDASSATLRVDASGALDIASISLGAHVSAELSTPSVVTNGNVSVGANAALRVAADDTIVTADVFTSDTGVIRLIAGGDLTVGAVTGGGSSNNTSVVELKAGGALTFARIDTNTRSTDVTLEGASIGFVGDSSAGAGTIVAHSATIRSSGTVRLTSVSVRFRYLINAGNNVFDVPFTAGSFDIACPGGYTGGRSLTVLIDGGKIVTTGDVRFGDVTLDGDLIISTDGEVTLGNVSSPKYGGRLTITASRVTVGNITNPRSEIDNVTITAPQGITVGDILFTEERNGSAVRLTASEGDIVIGRLECTAVTSIVSYPVEIKAGGTLIHNGIKTRKYTLIEVGDPSFTLEGIDATRLVAKLSGNLLLPDGLTLGAAKDGIARSLRLTYSGRAEIGAITIEDGSGLTLTTEGDIVVGSVTFDGTGDNGGLRLESTGGNVTIGDVVSAGEGTIILIGRDVTYTTIKSVTDMTLQASGSLVGGKFETSAFTISCAGHYTLPDGVALLEYKRNYGTSKLRAGGTITMGAAYLGESRYIEFSARDGIFGGMLDLGYKTTLNLVSDGTVDVKVIASGEDADVRMTRGGTSTTPLWLTPGVPMRIAHYDLPVVFDDFPIVTGGTSGTFVGENGMVGGAEKTIYTPSSNTIRTSVGQDATAPFIFRADRAIFTGGENGGDSSSIELAQTSDIAPGGVSLLALLGLALTVCGAILRRRSA